MISIYSTPKDWRIKLGGKEFCKECRNKINHGEIEGYE